MSGTHPVDGGASNKKLPQNSSEGASPSSKNNPAAAAPNRDGEKKSLDPTRYGDWEKNGRCIDF